MQIFYKNSIATIDKKRYFLQFQLSNETLATNQYGSIKIQHKRKRKDCQELTAYCNTVRGTATGSFSKHFEQTIAFIVL